MSGRQVQLSVESGCLYLAGVLNPDAVVQVYIEGRAYIQDSAGDEMILDLSRLESSDSSGLALLLDWSRSARENSVQLHFHNLPQQLLDIARVCGLGEFIDSMSHAA